MFCSGCGTYLEGAVRFCRKCGLSLDRDTPARINQQTLGTAGTGQDQRIELKDPDEMIGNGIGSVIVGDGFLMVAVILGATQTPVSSLLWLLLLLPAFFFFGKGFADVLHAQQIRRRIKQAALHSDTAATEVTPLPGAEFVRSISGALFPSVTERTTRDLK